MRGGERGQTGSEYLGGLLLVAAIVAALVASGVPGKVAGEVDRLVCEISGGRCEDAPPAAQTAVEGGGPDQGPAIPNGPLDVLPFPGSVSVTCTVGTQSPAPAKDPKACKGPDAPGGRSAAVQASGTVTSERSGTKLNAKGCPVQTLSTATTLKLEVGATGKKVEGDKKIAVGKLAVFTATQSKYQVTLAPDQAEDLEHGRRQPPNPVDPRTLRPGETIQMSEEFYAGHNLQAEYRAIQAQLGYEQGRRVSSAVTRLDPTTMRVYVGDEEFVRQATTLGIGGKGAKIGINVNRELAEGKLRAVDIDISGPEGWNAYQQFVATGKLPADGAPGTKGATSAKTTKFTDARKAEAELGNVKIGFPFGSTEGNVTETTFPDGTVETSVSGRHNDVGLEYIERRDTRGNPIGEPSFALNLQGVDPEDFKFFQQLNGRDPGQRLPDGNLRLEFTRDDLETIRRQALAQIAWEAEIDQNLPRRPSIEEIEADPEKYSSTNPHIDRLARVKHPDEIPLALFRLAGGNTDDLMDILINHVIRTNDAEGKPPGSAGRLPGDAVGPSCAS